MDDYSLFLLFIEQALLEIDGEYFYTQFNQFHAIRNRMRPFGIFNGRIFRRHSERGFAYELYFHLRSHINSRRQAHDFFPNYFLQGEIKKMDVEEALRIFGYERLGGHFVPDILFHIPSQDANAFVIEIKAQPELEEVEILYDMDKLSRFLIRFNYQRAIFIAVNISPYSIINAIRNNAEAIRNQFTNERLSDCNIIVKHYPGNDNQIFNQTISQILG
jgi:hypothetical protein